ncbi:HlyD family efflux transporter periplasmic adaptor subunit [Natronohydrobacter thiooxidans]|uniref:HlyD family efflux transporter periplasmic adaptor subunit n=1 Tax=Natronohydrobacter thiooxidans TaxID=87172 RepID=UPI0008FF3357|nr:HlyD family efflux transporter periplasmic adaptor subunit [Natronohydrobacter thiooxidans]
MNTSETTGARNARPGDKADAPKRDDWEVFANPPTPMAFLAAWFRLLCTETGNPRRAVLLLRTVSGSFAPLARWPENRDAARPAPDAPDPIATACEAAQKSGATALRPAGDGMRAIAFPVVLDDKVEALLGMIVPDAHLRATLRRLHWGAGWLYGMIANRQAEDQRGQQADTHAALQVLAALGESDGLEAAARALVNEILPLTGADRVSLALMRRGRLRLVAQSQTAEPETRSALLRALVQAMEEARVQLDPVLWSAAQEPKPGVATITAAHAAHASRAGALGMISAPLVVAGRVIGVLSLERMSPRGQVSAFGPADLARLEVILGLCAPVIELRAREHRLISGRGRIWLGKAIAALFGKRHPGIRLAALLALALLAGLGFARTDLRIRAQAELRGEAQRVVVAPFDGFVATAPLRAGDVVQSGDVLATLDEFDLRLDLLRWQAERARFEQDKSTALAAGDRTGIAAADAEIARVSADLSLAEARLARVALEAPFDGVIIAGDLSQLLGAPVKQGEELFRLASGNGLRLDIWVGEYDIALVAPGAQGVLALSGMSGATLRFEVARIAEVAQVQSGQNGFRIEARLIDPQTGLLPGLEGVARISAGSAPVLRAWLRPVTERLRILWWSWIP